MFGARHPGKGGPRAAPPWHPPAPVAFDRASNPSLRPANLIADSPRRRGTSLSLLPSTSAWTRSSAARSGCPARGRLDHTLSRLQRGEFTAIEAIAGLLAEGYAVSCPNLALRPVFNCTHDPRARARVRAGWPEPLPELRYPWRTTASETRSRPSLSDKNDR
jgi:hypothetical protein